MFVMQWYCVWVSVLLRIIHTEVHEKRFASSLLACIFILELKVTPRSLAVCQAQQRRTEQKQGQTEIHKIWRAFELQLYI